MSGVVFQCGSCRALTQAQTAIVEATRAGLACSACGAVTYLPDAHTSGTGPTVVVDADAAARATSTRALPASTALVAAPSSSGLPGDARDQIAAKVARIGVGEGQAELAAQFDQMLGHWDADSEHDRFVKKASMLDQLAFAGQRYRAVLEVRPADAHAKDAQNRIMTLAMAALGRNKELGDAGAPARTKNALTAAAAVMFLVATLVAIWFVQHRLLPPVEDGATMAPTTKS